MPTKEQIKQKIQMERGEFKRERRKRFLHLKNTGKYVGYISHESRMPIRIVRVKWYKRLWVWFLNLIKSKTK